MDGTGTNGGRWHPYNAYWFLLDIGMWKTAKFCLYHSRFMVENYPYDTERHLSRLAVADKLAVVYTPLWMYCKEELDEYIGIEFKHTVTEDKEIWWASDTFWKNKVDIKCLKFVEEWKDKAYDISDYYG